jgi:hypothetical protein
MVVREALADLRTTRGDCPEPLLAAIDNTVTLLREAIKRGRQEPLPGGMPVVQLPPAISLSTAHAAVADPTRTLEERLRAVVHVEDAVLIGIRTIAFVRHTQPTTSRSAKNAALILEELLPLAR